MSYVSEEEEWKQTLALTEAILCEILSQAFSHSHPWNPLLPLHGLEKQQTSREHHTCEQCNIWNL